MFYYSKESKLTGSLLLFVFGHLDTEQVTLVESAVLPPLPGELKFDFLQVLP